MAMFVEYVCDEPGCDATVRGGERFGAAPPDGWSEVTVRVMSEFNPRCSTTQLFCPSCTGRLGTAFRSVGAWLEARGPRKDDPT